MVSIDDLNEVKIMAIELVREHFKKYGLEHKIMEYDASSATVELAAQALGVAPERNC